MLAAAVLAQAGCGLAATLIMGRVALDVACRLRRQAYERLLRAEADTAPGVVLSRLTDDVACVQGLVSAQTVGVLTDLGTTAIAAGWLLSQTPGLFLVAAVVVPVVVLHFRAYSPRIRVGVVMTRVSLEVVMVLTDTLHRKLRRQPQSFLDRHQTGGLMARLTSDVGSVMIFLNTGTLQLVSDLVLAVGIAGVLVWLHGPLAVVALTAVPLAAVSHIGFAGPLRRRSRAVRSAVADLYALLSERLPAVRVVRAFNQETAELARLDRCLAIHAAASVRGLRVSAMQTAAAGAVGGLGVTAVAVVGAWLAAVGRLSAGDLLTFYALCGLLYAPIIRLAQFQGGWAAVRVAVERMAELLDEPDPPAGNVSVPRSAVRGPGVGRGPQAHLPLPAGCGLRAGRHRSPARTRSDARGGRTDRGGEEYAAGRAG